MGESNQLALYVKNWNPLLVPALFGPSQPDAGFSPRQLFLSSLTQKLFEAYLEFAQADDAATYADPVDDEAFQDALDSLNRLFSCQPGTVIETFADYLCDPNVDWLRDLERQELVSSSVVSPVPPDRQVRIEAAAKDHVVHLETITLAEEQEAPTASVVGQILISGRAGWMKLKGKLLSSFSRFLRNRSVVGLRIAFADAVQA